MASVKIILYTKKTYTDGTHPVILQIIAGKSIKRKVLANIKPDQWDDENKRVKGKKHANAHKINETIRDEFNRVEDLILTHGNNIDLNTVFPDEKISVTKESGRPTFWQIADMYLEQVKAQSGSTYMAFRSVINKFKRCIEDDNLLLSDIDKHHISKFSKALQKGENSSSTQNLNWRVLRFVSNYATREGLDTQPKELHNFKLPSRKSTSLKRKLTKEELIAFAAVQVKDGTFFKEAQDIFLLSVYLRGVRISDMILMKQSYLQNGRYVYKSSKNKKNFDIKLIPEALEIINRYKDGRTYLFNWYQLPIDPDDCTPDENVELANEIKRIVANINTRLMKLAKRAGINKPIRTHIARHTFAKIAADNIDDRRVTMALLGHGDLKTHQAYIMEVLSSDELDDAVDNIF